MPTLFEIGEDMLTLESLLSELGGDVTDEQVEQAMDSWFAEVEENMDRKLDGYGTLIAEFQGRADFRAREAKRLAERANIDKNNADRLKARLKLFMDMTGRKKVDTQRFTFAIQKNGGKVPMNVHCAPAELPEEFRRIVIEPDTDKIRTRLEIGETLEFAELLERGTHLRIK